VGISVIIEACKFGKIKCVTKLQRYLRIIELIVFVLLMIKFLIWIAAFEGLHPRRSNLKKSSQFFGGVGVQAPRPSGRVTLTGSSIKKCQC